MVGKGVDPKASRIFHQCYLKCCKLQNLTPLSNVIPGSNGQVLDFCVDRIRYQDWPPILNALSCDLSLHSVGIRCRQPTKTVLENIDCERLAKTVNKRCVVLTNFMMTNLTEAVSQLLSNTTLLTSLLLEGLPLKIPYLNPLCEAILANNSLQHLYLPRCNVGDAGCLAICKAVRCLPNILTLDLTGCEVTQAGAGYIADLLKYQKIHRYSENWVHTLRYRLPELDTMAGLRRITLCDNPQLGNEGASLLLEVLADDLWIKAVDMQNCGLSEKTVDCVFNMMRSNTTLIVLDLRHNPGISNELLSKVRAALRENENKHGRTTTQYSWLGSSSSSSSSASRKSAMQTQNAAAKPTTQRPPQKYVNKPVPTKKEKDYTENLEEQLQEEISHRQQLEELNLQLVEQMKQLKQEHMTLWANNTNFSGSEQSLQGSSGDLSSSSGSSTNIPIDQNTLSYIQRAFKDIYAFIKNNQCHGQCLHSLRTNAEKQPIDKVEEVSELDEMEEFNDTEAKSFIAKKAQSTHYKLAETMTKTNKATKSAHLLGELQMRDSLETKPEMFEKHMGDSMNAHGDEVLQDMVSFATGGKPQMADKLFEMSSPCSSSVSDSSDTLVCAANSLNPRDAFSSDDDDDSA